MVQDRPDRSPGLDDYPDADTEVQQLADELWGDCNGKQYLEHRLGQGRLVWMKTWSETADPETEYILGLRKTDSPFYNRPAHTVVWSDSFLALLKDFGVVPDVEVGDIAGKPVRVSPWRWAAEGGCLWRETGRRRFRMDSPTRR